jgi:hypothetical protein
MHGGVQSHPGDAGGRGGSTGRTDTGAGRGSVKSAGPGGSAGSAVNARAEPFR